MLLESTTNINNPGLNQILKTVILIAKTCTAPGGGGGYAPPHLPSLFFAQQKEKRETKEKKKSLKIEIIKRLSPRSKCYRYSHSTASRIQKFFLSANHGGQQNFSVFHGPSTLNYISPALV